MNAFYFVVDDNLLDIAGAQALHIADLWECDVHIFVERKRRGVAVRTIDHPKVHYHFDLLTKHLPSDLPSSSNWPSIVYLRLFAPQYLHQYRRLIYLDADVLVLRRAPEIWSISISAALAAVEDFGTHFELPSESKHMGRREWLATLGISSGRYFNSGVLLIDTNEWLRFDFAQLLTTYFEKYPHAERFDQDFLASVFDGDWAELSPRFNFQACLFSFGATSTLEPIFVHFSQWEKPWFGWRGEASTNLDEGFLDIYDRLIRRAGMNPKNFARHDETKFYRKLNFVIRRWMSQLGLPSSKERRVRRERQRRMHIFFNYVASQLANGNFADKESGELPSVRDMTYFDGRYFRTKVDSLDMHPWPTSIIPAETSAEVVRDFHT